MSATAATRPARMFSPAARRLELPCCPVCADTMIAAEASALLPDELVSHLWTCDTCGYGFVTQSAVKPVPAT